jgi:hypothetical protein
MIIKILVALTGNIYRASLPQQEFPFKMEIFVTLSGLNWLKVNENEGLY